MKVRELIERLQREDQDAEVRFVYNYGDYWNTDVAAEVKVVQDVEVVHSDYHQMDKIYTDSMCQEDYNTAREMGENYEQKNDVRRVVALSSSYIDQCILRQRWT